MACQVKAKTVVRVRPFNRREQELCDENIIAMSGNQVTITDPATNNPRDFTFDSCVWSHDGSVINDQGLFVPASTESRFAGQNEVFKDVGIPALEKAWEGYNACIIAYGTTGSGKSFTMLGGGGNSGLVQLCCKHLFTEMNANPQNKYKVTFSLLEIYNERVIDLLSSDTQQLRIRTRKLGDYVDGLTVIAVKTADQTEQVLNQGLANRMIAMTAMNASSSRSHLVLTLHFHQYITAADGLRFKRKSRIRFVDMAGSERASKTGATGSTLREGAAINMSVSALANVINSLANAKDGKKPFVPYRNSKFTHLLKDELEGNCALTWVSTISPSSSDFDETVSTLRMASRAGQLTQKAKVAEVNVDLKLKNENDKIAELKAQLASVESPETKTDIEMEIDACTMGIQQTELQWKDKNTEEKGGMDRGIWWSMKANVHQTELETTPFVQNVSEDSQLSGVVKHIIHQGHMLVGKSDTEKGIKLAGLGIQPCHAIMVNTGSSLTIAPCSRRATVHVNGHQIRRTTDLSHLDRIKLGASEFFILVGFPSCRESAQTSAATHTYEKCLTELATKHHLYKELQPAGSTRAQTAALVLFQEFTDLLPMAAQAQALAAAFGKNVEFDIVLSGKTEKVRKLFVQVTDKDLGMEWLWPKSEFETRKSKMDVHFDELLTSGKVRNLDLQHNPLYDADSGDKLLGSAVVGLHNIAYHLPVEDDVPLRDPDGKRVASIHLHMIACTSKGVPLSTSQPASLQDPKEMVGKELHLRLALSSFHDVLWANTPSRGVYCKVWMDGKADVLKTKTVYNAVNGKFQSKFHFAFDDVTEDLMTFLQTDGLHLELWGTQTLPSSTPQTSADQSVQSSAENADQGLELDLDLAQDLRQFFKDVGPVRLDLKTLKEQVDDKSQAEEVRLQSCSSQLQNVEDQLNQCVSTLKENVKKAIVRAKQS